MKLNRIIAFLFAITTFAAAYLVYTEYVYLLGFPDGSITELEHAERGLAYAFIGISFLAGTYFVCLGWTAGRRKIEVKLGIAVTLYSLCVFGSWFIDSYFRANLMDGSGG